MAKKRSNQADSERKSSSGATKREKAPAKKGTKSTGKSVGIEPTNNVPSSPSGLASLHICCGVLFFLAGLATRPLLSLWNDRSSVSRKLSEETSVGQPEGANALDEPLHYACDDADLSDFIHATPQRGMHVVCLSKDSAGVSLRLYPGAYNDTQTESIGTESMWNTIRKVLESDLSLPASGPLQQPWSMFTPRGERLVGADDKIPDEERLVEQLFRTGMMIIMEGGTWIWPGVRIGFKRNVDIYSIMPGLPSSGDVAEGRKIVIDTLSLRPLVVSVEGFMTKEECRHIQDLSASTMRYSGVSLMDHDKGKPASNWRTSQSTFLASGKDAIITDLEQRTASLTRIPKNHQEHVQVLRYGKEEKYDAHHDYFNPKMYQNDKQTMAQIQAGKRNRLATVFWYLSDVEKGGETIFPRHNGAPQPRDFSDCSRGLKVRPKEGKVIIFYSLDAAGRMDPLSLHGACKVEEGIKWAANKWVWNAPREYVSND